MQVIQTLCECRDDLVVVVVVVSHAAAAVIELWCTSFK
jgi:hypothetical protein